MDYASIHVSFGVKDLKRDKVVSVMGLPPYATPVSVDDLLNDAPGVFFTTENTSGIPRLCATKLLGKPMQLIMNDGTADYHAEVHNFEAVYCLNGHPSTVPIFRPK